MSSRKEQASQTKEKAQRHIVLITKVVVMSREETKRNRKAAHIETDVRNAKLRKHKQQQPEKTGRLEEMLGGQISKTQDELQWIVAQRLLSALTIPGFK